MVRPPPDSTPFPFATLFRSERRLPARGERLYELVYAVTSDLPRLALELTGAPSVPPRLARALQNAALDARSCLPARIEDRKSTRLNSSHLVISHAVFCLKKT